MENVNVNLRRRVAVVALVLAPVVSSCGFDAPTDQVYTPGEGVNERSGSVDVLHALIVSGSEGSGTVIAGLSNNDQASGDALTEVAGAGEDSGLSVRFRSPVELDEGGSVQLADETPIFVEGERVKPGNFVELTFTFENGEPVTLEVPVVERTGDYADVPSA